MKITNYLTAVLLVAASGFSVLTHANTTSAQLGQFKRSSAANPSFGIQLTVGRTGMGSQTVGTVGSGNPMRLPIGVQLEYQPITSLGTLALGPSLEYQYFYEGKDPTLHGTNLMLAWAYGAQIRYSAHFSERQWLVPTAAYYFQRWNYKLTTAAPGEFNARGPSLGAWIYLNAIDRSSATTMRDGIGIQRAYLTLEWKKVEGNDHYLTIQGDSYNAGLRLEI